LLLKHHIFGIAEFQSHGQIAGNPFISLCKFVTYQQHPEEPSLSQRGVWFDAKFMMILMATPD